MKKELIFGSLLALSGAANAQWTTVGNDVYKTNTAGNVGIGTTTPANKLDILTTGTDDGIRVTQNTLGGAFLYLNNTTTNGRNWGVVSTGGANNIGGGHYAIYDLTSSTNRFFISGGSGSTAGYVGIGSTTPISKLYVVGSSVGIRGDATNAAAAYATQGVANGVSGSGQAIGITGSGGNGSQNFGGYFTGVGNGVGATAFGVYARVTNPGAGDWAGYFNGDVNIQGQAFCTASAWSSDRKLKSDIRPFMNAMDRLTLLKPSTYLFKTEEFKDMNLPKGNQIGLIAQELEEVFPELVSKIAATRIKDQDGNVTVIEEHKAVNYIGLIPVLISGLQEQQKQIEAQKAMIDQLMKSGSATGITTSNTSGVDGFALDQNIPNPFSQETVIKYNLPQQVSAAALVVYDLSGKQVASFPITEKGASSMTITSEKLAAGIYIYSVTADGKILDSKRMVVAQK